jgi:RecA/RadA recombinase
VLSSPIFPLKYVTKRRSLTVAEQREGLLFVRLYFASCVGVLQKFVPTGSISLNKLIGGGFPADGVSLIYGEAETGKSSLAIQCAVNCARRGYKSLFIDTDGTFSSERLSQIAEYDYEKISPFIITIKPTTFQEQVKTFDNLEKIITKKFRLIVVDTITSLYRVEPEEPREAYASNRELNRQMAVLTQIAETCGVAALVVSQVRSVPFGEGVDVQPVATRVLNYWSDVVLDLRQTGQTRVIKVLREKHSKIARTEFCYVTIERTGISDYGG